MNELLKIKLGLLIDIFAETHDPIDVNYFQIAIEAASKEIMDHLNSTFPKKKKTYMYHIGGEYGTDHFEDHYSNKEIDDWLKENLE